ncbi:MAG: RNA polymerase sigma factor (TIGR02999 family) [Chlamydiales bacterium]|jgi:RNA polymerase sigma factor (TIGR02999 family)
MDDPATQQTLILLGRMADGDAAAAEELLPLIYDELRRLAAKRMGQERSDHTLQATALVHEAYMRLAGPKQTRWNDRAHFFRTAARAMRAVLVDHARARQAQKRGGGLAAVELGPDIAQSERPPLDVLILDETLQRLTERDEQLGKIAELHFFGGLTHEEVAEAMDVSVRTIERGWRTARAWLQTELG